MKKLFFPLIGAFYGALCLVSCEKESGKAPVLPSLDVTEVVAAESSLTFQISNQNAVKCAFLVVESSEPVPSQEEVLDKGHAIAVNETVACVQDSLLAETAYCIVAVAASEDEMVSQKVDAMTLKTPALEFDADRGSAKLYGKKNVVVTLRTVVEGVDYELQLDMYDDEYMTTGYLTPRKYVVAANMNDGSVNSDGSYLQLDNDQFKFSEGEVEVAVREGKFDFEISLVLSNGKVFKACFLGALDNMLVK